MTNLPMATVNSYDTAGNIIYQMNISLPVYNPENSFTNQLPTVDFNSPAPFNRQLPAVNLTPVKPQGTVNSSLTVEPVALTTKSFSTTNFPRIRDGLLAGSGWTGSTRSFDLPSPSLSPSMSNSSVSPCLASGVSPILAGGVSPILAGGVSPGPAAVSPVLAGGVSPGLASEVRSGAGNLLKDKICELKHMASFKVGLLPRPVFSLRFHSPVLAV